MTDTLLSIPKQARFGEINSPDYFSYELFPIRVSIEGILVDAFPNREAFFQRLVYEAKATGKSYFFNVNAHIANIACKEARLKRILQNADVVYCDGAGISLASRILGKGIIPTRFANGDWLFDMWEYLADHHCTIYYLGGEPGVVEKGLELYKARRPHHNVVGIHHGFILHNKTLERQVIENINSVKPDVLFVGFGCPLQEYWIDDHIDELDVGLVYPIGASMDYVTGKVSRCPVWLGDLHLEWLFRLLVEPRRLYRRYLIGNPWFMARIFSSAIKNNFSLLNPKRISEELS